MDPHMCSDREDACKQSAGEEASMVSVHVVCDEPVNHCVFEFVNVPGSGDAATSIV